ncbi:hypothetical protein QZH41_013942 [Actinostola sp. cb2023]|nr:hypothetical protein QZH41_013942 [Actinostola sp. cb2023]
MSDLLCQFYQFYSPQPAVRSPQSADRSPQPAARSPQSAVRSPRFNDSLHEKCFRIVESKTTMKVICAGLLKTGTKSLASALRTLGYNVHDHEEHRMNHLDEYLQAFEGTQMPDFAAMYANVDAVIATPACFFWKEIFDAFPDAKVVLMIRDNEEVWQDSCRRLYKVLISQYQWNPFWMNVAYRLTPTGRKWRRFVQNIRRRIILKTTKENPDLLFVKNIYSEHNARVQSSIPRDQLLLVYNVNQGWQPLCEFLGVEVPDVPFPRLNVDNAGIADLINKTHLWDRMKNELALIMALVGLIGTAVVSYVVRLSTRACSVRLALEHDVTRKVSPTDVIEFLYGEAACEEGAIKCVQVDRDGSIVVTFESQEYVEKILDLGMLTINGYPVVVSSVDARRRYVKIYYLPYEVSNQQLQAALSEYGHVYHVRRDLCYDFKEIESGVRTVTMTVNKEVPSFLKVMGSEVKVYYRGQRQTCRKCGSASHFAKDCPNTQCFRCHGLGHVSRECTMVERCERCGEEGHTSWSCKAAFKFTAPSKVVDSQSTAEAHQGRQQSQLSSPLGFVFAPPSQIWSTAEVETPIKGTSSCTEDAESGTGATQELYTPQSSTNTVESKGPAEIVEEMIKVMKHPPKDDTETDNMLSGGSDSESAIGEGDGQDNMSSVESDIESDMEAVSGTAKRPASPVTSPRAKLKRDMEEIESVVKQRHTYLCHEKCFRIVESKTTMKVICAGLLKTGTKSLASALRTLGYNVHDHEEHRMNHLDEYLQAFEGTQMPDFAAMYADVDAVIASPACFFWKEIFDAFPDAKVVLMVRDNEEVWRESCRRCYKELISQFHSHPFWMKLAYRLTTTGQKWQRFCQNIESRVEILKTTNEDSDPVFVKNIYSEHNARVQSSIPRDQLLVYNVKQGWQPLCEFLGVEVPDVPFPRLNVNNAGIADLINKSHLWDRMKNELALILALVGLISAAVVSYVVTVT